MDMNYRGGIWEGGGGQDRGVKGRKRDNCNNIINKYIKRNVRWEETYWDDHFLNYINV